MTKKFKTVEIDFNPEFQSALDMMEETNKNIFITGRAGTGKSTLLNYFHKNTGKNVVILAPTGVAAVNVGGQTIHSFFHFKPNVTVAAIKKKRATGKEKTSIYKKLKTIVIDEVSMMRADLLDCVDKFLRLNGPNSKRPFGGVQMIFIGDLYQLPPVVSGAEREIFRSHYASPLFFQRQSIIHSWNWNLSNWKKFIARRMTNLSACSTLSAITPLLMTISRCSINAVILLLSFR